MGTTLKYFFRKLGGRPDVDCHFGMTNALDQLLLGAGQRFEILDFSKFAQPSEPAAVGQNRRPIVRNNDLRQTDSFGHARSC